jgi:hypothetical protein
VPDRHTGRVTSPFGPTGPTRSSPGGASSLARLATTACCYRFLILTVWALLLALRAVGHGHGDWDFFADAARSLFGVASRQFPTGGGLSLFADNPDIVTGPLTLISVRLLTPFGPSSGYGVAVVASSLLGVIAIGGLDAASRALGRKRAGAVLLGGILLLPAWSELAGYGHLDDALAFAFLCWGLWAVAVNRPIALGVCLGLAIATKQWGAVFVPLALALPAPRDKVRAGAIAIGIGAVAWLPFVLANSRTISQAGNFQVVADDSTLALFDYPRLLSPSWIRPAQLLVALALVTIAVLVGRWPGALLLGVAARVALDPATWSYYTAGLVLGALAWDVLATRRTIPVWTLLMFIALAESAVVLDDPNQRGLARLIACAATLLVLLPRRVHLTTRGGPPEASGAPLPFRPREA